MLLVDLPRLAGTGDSMSSILASFFTWDKDEVQNVLDIQGLRVLLLLDGLDEVPEGHPARNST